MRSNDFLTLIEQSIFGFWHFCRLKDTPINLCFNKMLKLITLTANAL